MYLVDSTTLEEQRYVRESFEYGEELSRYDMFFNVKLIKKLKKIHWSSKKIKDEIAEPDHWTDKSKTRAVVDNLIRDILLIELPECYDECLSGAFRMQIYEYVYTRYSEVV